MEKASIEFAASEQIRLKHLGSIRGTAERHYLMTESTKTHCIIVLAVLVLLTAGTFAQSNSTPTPVAPAASADQPTGDKPSVEKTGDKKAGEKSGRPHGAHSDSAYVIGANDVLSIDVWKEPDISRSVPVRSDGKISLALVGELQAGGQTPQQLEQEITKRLQSYISEPEVTVIVTDSKSQKVNILGMVTRPGAYLLTSSTTVLDAIAMAGGFKDFAKQKSVYVLRTAPDGTQQKLTFNYKDVIKGKNAEQNIRLQAGDTVVIP
jgi:polysaccharide biosynthesis/export protein